MRKKIDCCKAQHSTCTRLREINDTFSWGTARQYGLLQQWGTERESRNKTWRNCKECNYLMKCSAQCSLHNKYLTAKSLTWNFVALFGITRTYIIISPVLTIILTTEDFVIGVKTSVFIKYFKRKEHFILPNSKFYQRF